MWLECRPQGLTDLQYLSSSRMMHLSNQFLQATDEINKLIKVQHCLTCLECKSKGRRANNNPMHKEQATSAFDMVQSDVLQPATDHCGYIILLIDVWSRFIFLEYVQDLTTEAMINAFRHLIVRFRRTPRQVFIDRQRSWTTSWFQNYLVEQDILLKYVPFNDTARFFVTRRGRNSHFTDNGAMCFSRQPTSNKVLGSCVTLCCIYL